MGRREVVGEEEEEASQERRTSCGCTLSQDTAASTVACIGGLRQAGPKHGAVSRLTCREVNWETMGWEG